MMRGCGALPPLLYEHQASGAQWLAERTAKIGGGYLADDMGLGKTRTLLHALTLVGAKRPLVVCPAIVRTHWRREGALLGRPNLEVRSYEEVTRGGTPMQQKLNPDVLIADEAHYCKSMEAQRTRRVFGKGGYASQAQIVFPASGTPMPKNPLELWPVLSAFPEVCKEFKLPNATAFRDRYCAVVLMKVRNRHVVKMLPQLRNEAEFLQLLDRCMLRRTAAGVGLDVPALDWQQTLLNVPAPEMDPQEMWEAVLKYETGGAAALGDYAKWRHALGDAKVAETLPVLFDLLERTDEKLVVFAHHRSVLHKLVEGLRSFGIAYVDGETPPNIRDQNIDRFQTDPKCRVFIGQNIACQTGITLTAARRVVLVEPDYTADVNRQLGRRVARIGQTAEHCIVQMVVAADTLDELILERNAAEIAMAEKAGLDAA